MYRLIYKLEDIDKNKNYGLCFIGEIKKLDFSVHAQSDKLVQNIPELKKEYKYIAYFNNLETEKSLVGNQWFSPDVYKYPPYIHTYGEYGGSVYNKDFILIPFNLPEGSMDLVDIKFPKNWGKFSILDINNKIIPWLTAQSSITLKYVSKVHAETSPIDFFEELKTIEIFKLTP